MVDRFKMTKKEKATAKKATQKQLKLIEALTLIDDIIVKVATLKHGYIANELFKELKEKVSKL